MTHIPPITEAAFLKQVVELARLRGWMVYHQRPALTRKGWRTALQGDAGFPDLVLVRAMRSLWGRRSVIFAELKSETGVMTEAQRTWGAALAKAGICFRCWRPSDWPEIEETLK